MFSKSFITTFFCKILLLCVVLHIFFFDVAGQVIASEDSVIKKDSGISISPKTFIFPAALIAFGALGNSDGNGFILNKYEVAEESEEHFHNFKTHIDNYLQYAPIAIVYGMDLAGYQGVHDALHQTILLAKSELLMGLVVLPLKIFTYQERPDNSNYHSFPSGHTAQAFLSAEFLRREYGAKYPWLAVGGYAMATATGALRVLNNKHWASDVIAGAGVGILSVDVVYYLDKRHHGNHYHKWTALPFYNGATFGVSASMRIP